MRIYNIKEFYEVNWERGKRNQCKENRNIRCGERKLKEKKIERREKQIVKYISWINIKY